MSGQQSRAFARSHRRIPFQVGQYGSPEFLAGLDGLLLRAGLLSAFLYFKNFNGGGAYP
jgi:hypothetical protein